MTPRLLSLLLMLCVPSLVVGACSSDDGGTADTIVDTSTGVDTDSQEDADEDTSAGSANVVLNEISSGGSDDWIELTNIGDAPADLSGWTFSDDDPTHVYTFRAGTVLPVGAYLRVERDAELGFDFGLGGADQARIANSDGLVDMTSWSDGDAPEGQTWGRLPDGTGDFRTLYTPTPGASNEAGTAPSCGNGELESTETCDGSDIDGRTCADFGSPGGTVACAADCNAFDGGSCDTAAAGVVINEVSADSDMVELTNTTSSAVDIGSWSLVDDNPDNAWVIPAGTTLEPGGYVTFTRDTDFTFGLSGNDSVTLTDGEDTVRDSVDWRGGEATVSWCRIPDGSGPMQPCATPTFGAAN